MEAPSGCQARSMYVGCGAYTALSPWCSATVGGNISEDMLWWCRHVSSCITARSRRLRRDAVTMAHRGGGSD